MADLQVKIDKFNKIINDPRTEEDEKKKFKSFVQKLEAKQKAEMDDNKSEKKPAKKEKKEEKKPSKPKSSKKKQSTTPKKTGDKNKSKSATKPTKKKSRKGVKTISATKVEIDGKEVDVKSQEFCDYLVAKFKERRAKSKASPKKRKTTSVMTRVSSNIEKGITQAIKGGMKAQEKQIDKNPKQFIGKMEKLEKSSKDFLQDLKEVMGSAYDKSEVQSSVKDISNTIDELKKKIKESKEK